MSKENKTIMDDYMDRGESMKGVAYSEAKEGKGSTYLKQIDLSYSNRYGTRVVMIDMLDGSASGMKCPYAKDNTDINAGQCTDECMFFTIGKHKDGLTIAFCERAKIAIGEIVQIEGVTCPESPLTSDD